VKSIADDLKTKPQLASRIMAASPWEAQPQQLAEFVAFLLINQPPEKFSTMLAQLAPDKISATLDETKETMAESFAPTEIGLASYDPLGLMRSLDMTRFAASGMSEFSSSDGTFRVIYLEAPAVIPDYRAAIRWMKDLRAAIAALHLPDGVKIAYTGEPSFVGEISGQMEWDMMSSGIQTVLAIGIIFWLCYRRLKPLLDLNLMLVGTFVLSLAVAGWLLDQLTVIGVGFASIMIGLSVDYGFLVYEESRTHRDRASLWRVSYAPVMWAALTTAAAFLTLNFSSLPGLNQLGNLVALGVVVGAVLMLSVYLRLCLRPLPPDAKKPLLEKALAHPGSRAGMTWLVLALVVALLGVLVVRGLPGFDASPAALRMRHSDANDALERLYSRLTDERNYVSFVVTGTNEAAVLGRLQHLQPKLDAALANGTLVSTVSPLPLWPAAENQRANLAAARQIIAEKNRLADAVNTAGFNESAFALTGAIFDQWKKWSDAGVSPIWPDNEASRWILRRTVSREPGRFIAMGITQPAPGAEEKAFALQSDEVNLVSWSLLGRELKRVIPREFALLIGALVSVVLLLVSIAYRNLRDVVLMATTMSLVFLTLMGAMRALGMQWDVFNLAAVMLLLGTGTDYSIHMLLALNRGNGEIAESQRSMGLVILLCSVSTMAGFGTLAWASHVGLASLARVCAIGMVLDGLINVFLLPQAWRWWKERQRA
jgi:predicted exporter